MACIRCGTEKTIRAHLIPRSFAREVQRGKVHAVVAGSGKYRTSQSGRWDDGILCADCDQWLGRHEATAKRAFARLRRECVGLPDGIFSLLRFSGEDMLRFCAAILWKYAATTVQDGRIDLGVYGVGVERIAFESNSIPTWFDAICFRLRQDAGDDGVFAYSTPRPDLKHGCRGFRFMVGGCLVFVRVDRRSPRVDSRRLVWARGRVAVPILVAQASVFDEYQRAVSHSHADSPLGRFLKKQ